MSSVTNTNEDTNEEAHILQVIHQERILEAGRLRAAAFRAAARDREPLAMANVYVTMTHVEKRDAFLYMAHVDDDRWIHQGRMQQAGHFREAAFHAAARDREPLAMANVYVSLSTAEKREADLNLEREGDDREMRAAMHHFIGEGVRGAGHFREAAFGLASQNGEVLAMANVYVTMTYAEKVAVARFLGCGGCDMEKRGAVMYWLIDEGITDVN